MCVRKFAKNDRQLRHVCLFVRMEQLVSHLKRFHEIWRLSVFRKSVEKIRVSLKSDTYNAYFTWRPMSIYDHNSLTYFYSEKCFRKKLQWKSKNTFLCTITIFFFENLVVYEIMWKKIIVKPDKPQMTIWHIRIACWIPKATDTPSEYVILIVFTLQQWLHERASMLRFTYIAPSVYCGTRRSKQLPAGSQSQTADLMVSAMTAHVISRD